VIGNMTAGIFGILNKTGEEAPILKRGGKTDGKENIGDFLVPMSRAVAKAIEGPEKKPIFIWLSLWITQGRLNNGNLFQGQICLGKMRFCNHLSRGGDAF
jgi:hypothetical protein